MEWWQYVASGVVGYLLGCFSTAYIVGMVIKKRDIRKFGSGNAGTTNILRTFGKKMGVLTFLGDVAKGVLAVYLGSLIAGEIGSYIAAVLAVVGHNWPATLGFRGGKGIATIIGILVSIYPLEGFLLFAFCIVIVVITKYFSVASMIGCLLFPVMSLLISPGNTPRLVMFILLAVLGIFSHRENIKRILNGTENKVDFSKLKP
ncbi:MAG: glycerol-3-phosphate 1-O-acyltransferase PlsY [Christensenellales bacterium]|jgi:glycerol-3-phosphate acyltransferase PlsY